MPYRNTSTMGGKPLDAFLQGLIRSTDALAERIKRLEAIVSNGTTPADTRFEAELNAETNELLVFLRRVSTDERLGLLGASSNSLTNDQMIALVAEVLAHLPPPIPGEPGAPGADGMPGVPGVVGEIDGGPP